MRKRSYFVLMAISAVVFGLASYQMSVSGPRLIGQAKAMIAQSILASICASFVFLFALDGTSLVREVLYRRHFTTFFGDLADSSKATLVYPEFVLSTEARDALKDLWPTIYAKRTVHYPGSRFIDIPQIVASNDLQAMVIVATSLGRLLGDSPHLLTDWQAVLDPSRSFVSFGLTSNCVTDLYLGTDPDPLFDIEDKIVDPKILVQQDGQPVAYDKNQQIQHAIILRYRPCPEEYPNTFWFICAGLAAAGTPAAAYSLAHKWKQYHKRFKKSDFLIILKTNNDVLSYTTSVEVAAKKR